MDAVVAEVALPLRAAVTVLNVGELVVSSNWPGEYTDAAAEPLYDVEELTVCPIVRVFNIPPVISEDTLLLNMLSVIIWSQLVHELVVSLNVL